MTIGTTDAFAKARTNDLICEPVGDELVVYDKQTSEVHALKPLAALLLTEADGSLSASDLASSASLKLGRAIDVPEIEAALAELADIGLLEGTESHGISRRRLLQVGGVAAAGAFVTTALAPAYASAASGCTNQPTALPSGFSDIGVVYTDGTYWYRAKFVNNSGTPTECDNSFNVGGCTWPPSPTTTPKLPWAPTPPGYSCPAGLSLIYSNGNLEITVPSPYKLVGFAAHNGNYGCITWWAATPVSGCTSTPY